MLIFRMRLRDVKRVLDAGNRSLMDRTPDSDSGNAGSIPAGCILTDVRVGICAYMSQELFDGQGIRSIRHRICRFLEWCSAVFFALHEQRCADV